MDDLFSVCGGANRTCCLKDFINAQCFGAMGFGARCNRDAGMCVLCRRAGGLCQGNGDCCPNLTCSGGTCQ